MVDPGVVGRRRGQRRPCRVTVEPSVGEVTDTDGGVVSIWISWELTASALPALSNARYFTVVVDATGNGPL